MVKKAVQQGRESLARSRRVRIAWLIPKGEPFVFDARSVPSVREHGKRARTPRLSHPERWPICFQHSLGARASFRILEEDEWLG